MATNNTTATNYLVMGLVMGVGGDGQPVLKTVSCGSFDDIAEAFDLANELAENQWRQLLSAWMDEGREPTLEIVSTEEGYDIVNDGTVLERFWILDRYPTELKLR